MKTNTLSNYITAYTIWATREYNSDKSVYTYVGCNDGRCMPLLLSQGQLRFGKRLPSELSLGYTK